MKKNIFFLNRGPISLNVLFPNIKKNTKIFDIKPLNRAKKNELTFFDSIKYKELASKTQASACITFSNLEKYLPKGCDRIIVSNVLLDLAKTLKNFYPYADIDYPDLSLKKPIKLKFKTVKFGNNVLVGKNVEIGKNSIIGSNSILEKNITVGKNCVIGSDVVIKNSLLGDNVVIQDGCKIGLKGFGFIPMSGKNFKFPHIGKVIINSNVEIGGCCTIDRGSIDDTIIDENSYLDNQVHIAHNVKIGKNCMIAGQVGFAGSATLGNNVSIGGQAGISGHLKIGNNVKIAGGSGVIKDIEDNSIVMGYPAIPLKKFIKNSKNND
jgi:UDP-3-O-[3-hydroxymyristoyl] glucosamine N-acyltransferase